MQAAPRRQWNFLNITEPNQSRAGEFQASVKRNATRDYRRYERMKLTEAYAKKQIAERAREGIRVMSPGMDSHALEVSLVNRSGKTHGTSCNPSRRKEPRKLDILPCRNPSRKSRELVARDIDQSETVKKQRELSDADTSPLHQMQTLSSHNTHMTSSPQTMLSAGMVDPFNTCPTNGQGDYHYLINNFILTFAPAFLPIDRGLDQNPVNRLWAWHSLTSPALSTSLLHCTSARLDAFYHRKPSPSTLFYRGEAIRHLNDALSDPETSTADTTIASVAIFVASGNVSGNPDELMLHMNALKDMVDLRGGLCSLGWHRTLGMFISWQDLITSTTTNAPPRLAYEVDPPPSIGELPDSDQEYSIPSIVMGMKSLGISKGNYNEIPQILSEIRHLTIVVESFRRSRGATPPEMLAFSKARSSLEYRLLLMRAPAEFVYVGNNYVFEACRIAAVIYINYVLQEFDPVFGVLHKLKGKLVAAIEAGEDICETIHGRSETSLLLWVFFMGGLLAEEDYDREWFAQRIAMQMSTLMFQTWDDIEGCLMQALWIKRMRNSACEVLWREVVGSLNRLQDKDEAGSPIFQIGV